VERAARSGTRRLPGQPDPVRAGERAALSAAVTQDHAVARRASKHRTAARARSSRALHPSRHAELAPTGWPDADTHSSSTFVTTPVLTATPNPASPVSDLVDYRLPLRFVRHGATAPNLAGLRCGGDLDVPLTAVGRAQAATVAQRIARLEPPVKLIVTSDLKRNRETADIIARSLPGVTMLVQPAFSERRLGEWNLRPIAETQAWLEARMTPPGGESDDEFTRRVADAVRKIKRQLAERPLLVGSKGVGRVLGELIGLRDRLDLGNAEVWEFDFAERPCLETAWGSL